MIDGVATGTLRSVEHIDAADGKGGDPMDKNALVEELQKTGRLTLEQIARWRDSSGLLAVLDAIGSDGANALVKVDGGRSNGCVYTVIVSGGKLGEAVFRKDGANLQELLHEAISFYGARVWARN